MKRRELIAIIQDARDAAKCVIDNWETKSGNDLAAAVHNLDWAMGRCDEAIAWWESDE